MKKVSEETKAVFRWMDENPDFENSELYKAFPGKGQSNLRMIKSKHHGIQTKRKSASTDTSIIASTEPEPAKVIEAFPPHNESISTSINTFINELFGKKEILFKILNDYDQTGHIPITDIKLEKPFRTVSFNLMESTIEDFSGACKKLGISQRKGVHKAMIDFIERQGRSDHRT